MTVPEGGLVDGGPAEPRPGVRGDLLSCFSASVATYLGLLGIPYEIVFGCQLVLAVRSRGDLLEFRHYHTPLSGDSTLYRIDFEWHGHPTPDGAAELVLTEVATRGAAVVTGCTSHLPWLGGEGRPPAPHWFVAHTPNGAGTIGLTDPFEWIDDSGEQLGFFGRCGVDDVGRFSYSPEPRTPELRSRERWALGVPLERPPSSGARPWQWLAARHVAVSDFDEREAARTLLARTIAVNLGPPSDGGWEWGPAALLAVRDELGSRLSDPGVYDIHNDLWVAARGRQLFAHALRRSERLALGQGLSAVAERVEEEVVPRWVSLTRLMRYNGIRVMRGGKPRSGVLDELAALAHVESRLLAQLAEVLP